MANDQITRQAREAEALHASGAPAVEVLAVGLPWYDELSRVVYKVLKSADLAEEVLQDTHSEVWQVSKTAAPVAGLKAYLIGAARNNAINRLRAQQAQARLADLTLYPLVSPETLALMREEIRSMGAALSPRQRVAVGLVHERGYTVEEAAGEMGITSRAVRGLLDRAKEVPR